METDLDPDPFVQFERWFDAAKAAGIAMPEAMTVATSGLEGEVSARVSLLKSFDHRGFVFYTNYNSRKAKQIHDNPRGAGVLVAESGAPGAHRRGGGADDGRGVGRLLRHTPSGQPARRMGLGTEPRPGWPRRTRRAFRGVVDYVQGCSDPAPAALGRLSRHPAALRVLAGSHRPS